MASRVTAEEHAAMVSDHKSGMKIRDIMKKYKRSASMVHKWTRRPVTGGAEPPVEAAATTPVRTKAGRPKKKTGPKPRRPDLAVINAALVKSPQHHIEEVTRDYVAIVKQEIPNAERIVVDLDMVTGAINVKVMTQLQFHIGGGGK